MTFKKYLVGGAVRDKQLKIQSNDNDWVVVGTTPSTLLSLGYTQVGADFPVFLHPETNEEYALARTERKNGHGYNGFETFFSPTVTLEEDLGRRDLTINAMAMDENGNITDPYNGMDDLHKKILRHVSESFADDPLRILRVARFSAKFPEFTIHNQTMDLMDRMVTNGTLQEISGERILQECLKSFSTESPYLFFEVLHQIRADEVAFGGSCNIQKIKKIMSATGYSELSDEWRLALAFSASDLPISRLESTMIRQKWPKSLSQSLRLLMVVYPKINNIKNTSDYYEFCKQADAFRRNERFEEFVHAISLYHSFDKDALLSAVSAVNSTSLEEPLRDIPPHLKQQQAESIKQKIFASHLNIALPIKKNQSPTLKQ